MKKTIEKTFCDDCGKEIPFDKPITTISIVQSTGDFGSIGLLKDFCWQCLEWRVNHSMSLIKDKSCSMCQGKGKVRQLESYHNDSAVWIKCEKCGGCGWNKEQCSGL